MTAPQSRSARREARTGPSDGPTAPADAPKPSRAGRNLPAAIGVGVGLGALIIGSLLVRKELMLVVIVLAIGAATWELRRALRQAAIRVPFVPVVVGCISMILSAYQGGGQ